MVVCWWLCSNLWLVHMLVVSTLPIQCWWPLLESRGCYCLSTSWHSSPHHSSDWLLGLWHISDLHSPSSHPTHCPWVIDCHASIILIFLLFLSLPTFINFPSYFIALYGTHSNTMPPFGPAADFRAVLHAPIKTWYPHWTTEVGD